MKNKYWIGVLFLLFSPFVLSQNVLLDDSFFDNSNKWIEEKTDAGKLKIYPNRDQYSLIHKNKTRAYITYITLDIDESRNFKIEAMLYKRAGSLHYGYGILWGGKDFNNFYSLLVSGDGQFLYGKVEDNSWYNITEGWKKNSAIQEGRKAFNKMTIIKKGNQYSFYINDVIVARLPFMPFYGNKIGFNVNKKQKIIAEYIKVEYIN